MFWYAKARDKSEHNNMTAIDSRVGCLFNVNAIVVNVLITNKLNPNKNNLFCNTGT